MSFMNLHEMYVRPILRRRSRRIWFDSSDFPGAATR